MKCREKRMSEKKKLGVIGGLGPEASCFFYSRVTEHTKASCDQEHIDIIILSHASLPDRTEAIKSGNGSEIIRLLTEDVKLLESLGVANIAVPCNTSHYFFDEVQKAVKVPMINMISESVKYAVERYQNVRKIGIMATDGTIGTGLYHRECEKFHVTPVVPSKERQADVMSLIYDEIKAGRPGSPEKFARVMEEFNRQGCDVVILACTELSVFKEKNTVPENCLDAMDVLVEESVKRSGVQYK